MGRGGGGGGGGGAAGQGTHLLVKERCDLLDKHLEVAEPAVALFDALDLGAQLELLRGEFGALAGKVLERGRVDRVRRLQSREGSREASGDASERRKGRGGRYWERSGQPGCASRSTGRSNALDAGL